MLELVWQQKAARELDVQPQAKRLERALLVFKDCGIIYVIRNVCNERMRLGIQPTRHCITISRAGASRGSIPKFDELNSQLADEDVPETSAQLN